MTEIEFTKQGSHYIGSFTATGEDVFIYINRKGNGLLQVSSTPDEDDCRPCTDYNNSHEYNDVCLKTCYPAGVEVIIKSATEVDYAGVTIEQEGD